MVTDDKWVRSMSYNLVSAEKVTWVKAQNEVIGKNVYKGVAVLLHATYNWNSDFTVHL